MSTPRIFAASIACLLAAGSHAPTFAQSSPTPQKPPTALQQLAVFFGAWSHETETHATPLWPAMKSTGTDTTRSLLDGHAVQAEFHDRSSAGEARYYELNWLDAKSGRIGYVYLGNDAYVETGTYAFDKSGDTWAWEGTFLIDGKPWISRGKGVLAPDRASFVQTGEISPDGKTWHPAFTKHAKRTAVLSHDTPPASAEAELIALEHAWARAYVAHDTATLARIEADGWACTDAEGKITTKAEDIRDVGSGTYAATEFVMSDLQVRVVGDTAIVTGRQTEVATMAGKDASAVFQITDTWIRRDGRWQCIATHLSKVGKP